VSGSYARPTTAARAAGGTRAYDAALPLGSVQQVRSAVTPAPSKTDARRTDTRERILYEASNLFAALGYHATTTREIARAVGIRQPSLFHHFASKPEIMQALLTYDLDAFSFVEALAAEEGPAAVRLYRYLRDDVALVSRSPYNLSGLYTDEVMGDPDFALWARRSDQLHAAVEQIARDGIDSGEFVPMDPVLVREAIAGILLRTLMTYSGGRPQPAAALGDEIASFVLRAILADPSTLGEVRQTAAEAPG
jgi:AcrR family transcriptional regulator